MKRRDFIKLAGVSAALFPVAPSVFAQQVIPSRRHTYRLTYKFDLPADGSVVLIFGGSQGARTLNRAATEAARELVGRRQEDARLLRGGSGGDRRGETRQRHHHRHR